MGLRARLETYQCMKGSVCTNMGGYAPLEAVIVQIYCYTDEPAAK
jgi:hypothetical protein